MRVNTTHRPVCKPLYAIGMFHTPMTHIGNGKLGWFDNYFNLIKQSSLNYMKHFSGSFVYWSTAILGQTV